MRFFFFCAAIALCACSSETSTPEPAADNERPSSVIGDPLHQALDRAESVQNTLDDRAADMRRRLEEAEGN
jgi:hypothetical protein